MKLASKVLHVDGYLLQCNVVVQDKNEGFRNTIIMMEYSRSESLGMELDFVTDAGMWRGFLDMELPTKLILWRKIE